MQPIENLTLVQHLEPAVVAWDFVEVLTLIAAQLGKHPEKITWSQTDKDSNPKYGICNFPSNVTPDGTCGGSNKYTCTNGAFETCCSSVGFCGSAAAHCG